MKTLKYFKYDLLSKKILETGAYTEKNISQAWEDLSNAFLDMGYVFAEESGRISLSEKSTREAEDDLQEICCNTMLHFRRIVKHYIL